MNFYLDHILCTSTVSYLQMQVFASSSLVPDYKKHKTHNYYKHTYMYLLI